MPPDVPDPAVPLMCRAQRALLAVGRFQLIDMPEGPVAAGGRSVERPCSHDIVPAAGHVRQVVCGPNEADMQKAGLCGPAFRHVSGNVYSRLPKMDSSIMNMLMKFRYRLSEPMIPAFSIHSWSPCTACSR